MLKLVDYSSVEVHDPEKITVPEPVPVPVPVSVPDSVQSEASDEINIDIESSPIAIQHYQSDHDSSSELQISAPVTNPLVMLCMAAANIANKTVTEDGVSTVEHHQPKWNYKILP